MRFTAGALDDLRTSVGHLPAETGALLGGDPRTGLISQVRFDAGATRTGTAYTPDVDRLNALLRDQWNPQGIRLLGFAHSHPAGHVRPSAGDALYARRILEAIDDLDQFEMPIVQTQPDTGRFTLHGWRMERGVGGHHASGIQPVPVDAIGGRSRLPVDWFDDPAFDRVARAVSLPLLARTRLVVVGVGGSAQFIETMVRQGVGEVVLIDPDRVEAPNLGTQQTYRSDIGSPKVSALAKRLADVNPDAVVRPIAARLDDLSDRAVATLATTRWPDRPVPEVVLWCGFTDDFWAQARVNRLALQHGHPMIAAQVYQEGRGVEVSFAAPGVTPACGRCALGNRYRAWLDHGWTTTGHSSGTPLCATDRLNALKGHLALALLHGCAGPAWSADPAGGRWRDLLDRIGDRNLVLVRLDPDIHESLGLGVFDAVLAGADHDRIVMDETVWLPQAPEGPATGYPPCGDCGGTGDLRNAIGTFSDTRLRQPNAAMTEVSR